ncbi:hypothetical protein [Streptomyces griseocarneus]|uniref:hypothetical protein n=1 Tax=Streptomyces griseocarneus TaxID=51201 RepID=UPI00167CB820|nr:hypothetical protein [Streptomyces griseocarneus]MBZ6473905.1 hypothetical protein [Streptomyces griseocarneus]GHG65830.1 hypothetical protein GCM10018779_36790 [Streptomyces griseocarneus]
MPPLTVEAQLRARVAGGRKLDLEPREHVTWEAMRAWGVERTISASALRKIILDSSQPGNLRGVQLRGARILGRLDLEFVRLQSALVLEDCSFDGPVALDYSSASRICFLHCEMVGLSAERLKATSLSLAGSLFPAGRGVRLSGARFTDELTLSTVELRGVDAEGVAMVADGVDVGGHVSLEGIRAFGAVQLDGAEINGRLDCSGARLLGCSKDRSALMADDAKVGGQLVLRKATTFVGAVRLMQASIDGGVDGYSARLLGSDEERNALVADGITVDGFVSLADVKAGGALLMPGAEIKGQLNLSHCEALRANSEGNTVETDGLTVRGGMFLRSFRAEGAVRLIGSDIALQLDSSYIVIKGVDGDEEALVADGIKVGGHALFQYALVCGGIRLDGAEIKGSVDFAEAVVTRANRDGEALNVDGATVHQNLLLEAFAALKGAVYLRSATVVGRLDCSGARLLGTDSDHVSLHADGVQVGEHLYLGNKKKGQQFRTDLRARGTVRLIGARINGSLRIVSSEMAANEHTALDATGAHIVGELQWLPVAPVKGKVILERATAHRLEDDWNGRELAYWPSDGLLQMIGFAYDGFGGPNQAEYEQRLDWVRCGHIKGVKSSPDVFATQPYEQLARVYKQMGRDKTARKVCIARRRDRRKHGKLLRPRRMRSWILDKTIAYGFKTWRMGFFLIALWGAVFCAASCAQQHDDLIVPVKTIPKEKATPTANVPQKDYPSFEPAAYAVDVAVPVLNLHQSEYWGPNGATPCGRRFAYFTYACTVVGWGTATLAVVGLTGLARRD